nr:unnamed protein product [Callosobruchus chinensis]
MSATFAQRGGQRPPPDTKQIQRLLDENGQLIQTIQEFQSKGKVQEVIQMQTTLHRNLVYLATLADSAQNVNALLPMIQPPGAPTGGPPPNQPGHGPQPPSGDQQHMNSYGHQQQPVPTGPYRQQPGPPQRGGGPPPPHPQYPPQQPQQQQPQGPPQGPPPQQQPQQRGGYPQQYPPPPQQGGYPQQYPPPPQQGGYPPPQQGYPPAGGGGPPPPGPPQQPGYGQPPTTVHQGYQQPGYSTPPPSSGPGGQQPPPQSSPYPPPNSGPPQGSQALLPSSTAALHPMADLLTLSLGGPHRPLSSMDRRPRNTRVVTRRNRVATLHHQDRRNNSSRNRPRNNHPLNSRGRPKAGADKDRRPQDRHRSNSRGLHHHSSSLKVMEAALNLRRTPEGPLRRPRCLRLSHRHRRSLSRLLSTPSSPTSRSTRLILNHPTPGTLHRPISRTLRVPVDRPRLRTATRPSQGVTRPRSRSTPNNRRAAISTGHLAGKCPQGRPRNSPAIRTTTLRSRIRSKRIPQGCR